MSKAPLFSYSDYKRYLQDALEGRGQKLKLSEHLGCQSAFISRVLSGQADLSLEQCIKAAEFLELGGMEFEYFVQLVHLSKAGSQALKIYYQGKLESIRKERDDLSGRLAKDRQLSPDEQSIFFSSWAFSAVLIEVMARKKTTISELNRRFSELGNEKVSKTVEFLTKIGLTRILGNTIQPGTTKIHLDRNSPYTTVQHSNWRRRAMLSAEKSDSRNFNFTGLHTVSDETIEKIRTLLINAATRTDEIAQQSEGNQSYCLCIDWFSV